jgi:hypothetical protein
MMRRALGFLAVLIVAVAVGLGVSVAIHHRRSADVTVPPTATTSTGPLVELVPGPGQAFVTGTLTSLTADNAVGPPLSPPFTITIPNRGAGSADLTGVQVGGNNVEIYWYGGQPLPFTGTGQLVIGGGGLVVNAAGTNWILDGATRTLTSGHFYLGSPVAVGSAGLATPEQSLSFDAGDRSTIVTTGQAQIHQAPAALHLTGPGSLTLHGTLALQTPTATSQVGTVNFGPGSFDITLTPIAGGDNIKATLQGPYAAR